MTNGFGSHLYSSLTLLCSSPSSGDEVLADLFGDDAYVDWKPSDAALEEVTDRYLRVCPAAKGENPDDWNSRCVPDEAYIALRRARVVDAQTIELAGEIARLANVNGPRLIGSACQQEMDLAAAAVMLLRIHADRMSIRRLGKDPQGRVFALIRDERGRDLGEMLVKGGYATPAVDRQVDWCS